MQTVRAVCHNRSRKGQPSSHCPSRVSLTTSLMIFARVRQHQRYPSCNTACSKKAAYRPYPLKLPRASSCIDDKPTLTAFTASLLSYSIRGHFRPQTKSYPTRITEWMSMLIKARPLSRLLASSRPSFQLIERNQTLVRQPRIVPRGINRGDRPSTASRAGIRRIRSTNFTEDSSTRNKERKRVTRRTLIPLPRSAT